MNHRINCIKRHILIFFTIIICFGCIDEDVNTCPDFGKYPIELNDDNSLLNLDLKGTLSVLYDGQQIEHRATTKAQNSCILYLNQKLSLFPGNYKLIMVSGSKDPSIKGDSIALKNGQLLFRADSTYMVAKKRVNSLDIRFKPLFALITASCSLDDSNYTLKETSISPPDDYGIYSNLRTNQTILSEVSGEFFIVMTKGEGENVRFTSVPAKEGVLIRFRFKLESIKDGSQVVLYSGFYLQQKLLPGNILNLRFLLTPNRVVLSGYSLKPWNEIEFENIIFI